MGKKKEDEQQSGGLSANEYVMTPSTLAAMTAIAVGINQGQGGGFFLAGPPGSGKSRFLMALQDLAATQGASPQFQADSELLDKPDVYHYNRRRASREIEFAREVFQTHRIAPCYVTLGDSSNQPLSAALRNAILQQYPQIFPYGVDLFACLDVIDAGLYTSNYDMLLVLVDGLTSYLNTKEMATALQDLLFLQQLGEALPDHSITIVLAVHESIRALDGIDYHDLDKFKERYRVLPLHIEGALARRFAVHFDDDDLEVTTAQSYYQKLQYAGDKYSRVMSRYSSAAWAKDALHRANNMLAELGRVLGAAQRAMSRHDYIKAAQLYNELLGLDPANEQAEEGVQRAKRINYLINQFQDDLQREEFASAFRRLQEALEIDPTNDELSAQLERVRETGLHTLLARAQLAESEGNYPKAVRHYEDALWLSPLHSHARARLKHVSSLLMQKLISQAEEAERRMDHAQASRLYEEALSVDPSATTEIQHRLARLHDRFADTEVAEPRSDACAPSVPRRAPRKRRASRKLAEAPCRPRAPSVSRASDPARKLAEILAEFCEQDDLDLYLQRKDITGRTQEARLLELCVREDPVSILTDLFGLAGLHKLAEYLDVEIEPGISSEQLREALLRRVGFSIPKKPTGISAYRDRLIRLRGTLRLKDTRADIIGIGLEGCDDVGECVLKDVIHFYCTVLMGRDYEQVLLECELLPTTGRSGLDSLTFGQKIGLFEKLNGHLKKNTETRGLMLRWFDRGWIIRNNTHVQKYLYQVSPRRNDLAHPEGVDTHTLKQKADEALDLLAQLLQEFEEQLIYPPVIAVEGQRIDRYGRRTYDCMDDRGRPERVFTALELLPGQEYFFYPVTNPIRVDPLIVPKR